MTRQRLWSLQARYAPYLFVAPFVVLFCVFMLYPMGRSVILSLYKVASPRTMRFVGTETQWTSKPLLAMPAIIMAALWLSVGYGMIYFLAALQGVDRDLYQAAEVDGAGRWARFWHITFPGIRPVLQFLVLVGL